MSGLPIPTDDPQIRVDDFPIYRDAPQPGPIEAFFGCNFKDRIIRFSRERKLAVRLAIEYIEKSYPTLDSPGFLALVMRGNRAVCARQTRKVKTELVFLIALAALTARGEDLAGHYVLQGVMEVGSELLLKSDGSFEYMLAYGAADYWAEGTWRHEYNCVVLNSAGKKEALFRLLRSEASKPGRICVWVIGKNGHGVENIQVALQAADQHFEATTNSDGAAEFPGVANAGAVAFEVRVQSSFRRNARPLFSFS